MVSCLSAQKSKIKIIIFFDITKKVEAFKVKNVAAVDWWEKIKQAKMCKSTTFTLMAATKIK